MGSRVSVLLPVSAALSAVLLSWFEGNQSKTHSKAHCLVHKALVCIVYSGLTAAEHVK